MYTSALVEPVFSHLPEGKFSTLTMSRIYKNWVWNYDLRLSYKQNISILHNGSRENMFSRVFPLSRCLITSLHPWWVGTTHIFFRSDLVETNRLLLPNKKKPKNFDSPWSELFTVKIIHEEKPTKFFQCLNHTGTVHHVWDRRVIQVVLHTQQHTTKSLYDLLMCVS